MHNHVANRGRKALLKQIFSVFLIFTLYFNSFNTAYASTSLGGWTITSQIAQGASLALSATKTAIINGANVIKTSTAKITPNASQVAKVLARGVAGYALSVAVEQLIGSVDWVLDPVNNQIKWKEEGTLGGTYIYLCTESINGCPSTSTMIHPTLKNPSSSFQYKDVCLSYATTLGGSMHSNTSSGTCIITVAGQNKFYGIGTRTIPAEEGEEKTIPLTVVAQKVIDNAESSTNNDHKVGAQVATTTAAQDMLANDAATQSDVETQLNANEKTQTSEEAAAEATPKDPAAPDAGTNIKITFPVFCSWAPIVCEAAQSAIKFPTTVTNWWNIATTSISDAWTWTKARYEAAVTSISDFFKNEPDQTDNNDLPIQEIPTPQLQTNTFTATAGCPEPIPIQIKIGVEGTAHISYEPICQFAEKWSFIAPLIGFLSGAMIIVGVGRKGEDSEI